LDLRDLIALLHWALPAALGAGVSYCLLSPNPDHHRPQAQLP
jgi:hypothetical protein